MFKVTGIYNESLFGIYNGVHFHLYRFSQLNFIQSYYLFEIFRNIFNNIIKKNYQREQKAGVMLKLHLIHNKYFHEAPHCDKTLYSILSRIQARKLNFLLFNILHDIL